MLDLNNPETPVEIHISNDGRLWVNVDGKCVLRIHGGTYNIEDERWFYYHHPESASLFKTRGAINGVVSSEPLEEVGKERYIELLDEYGITDPDFNDDEPPEHYGEPPPSPAEQDEYLQGIMDRHKR